jgi:hypothetical protein
LPLPRSRRRQTARRADRRPVPVPQSSRTARSERSAARGIDSSGQDARAGSPDDQPLQAHRPQVRRLHLLREPRVASPTPISCLHPILYSLHEARRSERYVCSVQAREPTSGLEPLSRSLRVITQALQGFAINSWWRWIKTITVRGRLCKLGRQGFQRKE